MLPDEQGKHCQLCDKRVYDFTAFSDAELIAFFKREQGVCGRFKSTQLNRQLHPTSTFNLKWAIAACSLLLMTHAELEAQSAVIATEDSVAAVASQAQTHLLRVVRVSIEQVKAQDERIIRMRMRQGNFSIETEIDSSNAVSISIPYTEETGLGDFELYNLQGDTFVLLGVNLGHGALNFNQEDGRWKHKAIKTLQILPVNELFSPILGNMTPIRLFEPWLQGTDFHVDATYPVSIIGDTIAVNHPDTLATNSKASNGAVVKAKPSKAVTGISTAWWAGIIGGIALVLGWFWRSRRERGIKKGK